MICRCYRLGFASVLILICLLNSGCGSDSGAATVTGIVECNGQSIPAGRVVFSSETTTCAGEISDGEYELKDKGKSEIPLGNYTITVFPPKMTVFNPDTGEDERVKGNVDLSLFPQKYQSTGTSDLKFSPKAGDNDFDVIIRK